MTDTPSWASKMAGAALAMSDRPVPLLGLLNALSGGSVTTEDLDAYLTTAGANSPGIPQLHADLARWDAAPTDTEFNGTERQSGARRSAIYDALELSATARAALDTLCPPNLEREVIISTDFEPWYETRAINHTMYWDDYYKYLVEQKNWRGKALDDLSSSTSEIVRRLSDPTRVEAKQTRGLVVGYVQSGKTANFTGLVARAIDAGYRLIIILTGTIELLRGQTQRRLDMELVGRENILAGHEEDEDTSGLDYRQDDDWIEHRFVEHGAPVATDQEPSIIRVTTHHSDYKRLPDEVSKLRFTRVDKNQPLNHPANLAAVDAYVAVLKKNPAPLKKLIADLKPLGQTLDELPVLIIDDESDQASVDTTNPKKKTGSAKDQRTAVNKHIGDVLGLCKRAQYVGYTATPFANVFINPDDDTDLFPSDFLISLPRPQGYMGVQEFHDVGRSWEDEDKTVANSNELAYVRPLEGTGDVPQDMEEELAEAVDAYVLSGAIKKYREAQYRAMGSERTFQHHTMIVHESMFTADAGATRKTLRQLWSRGQYTLPSGLARLRSLFDDDFRPVSLARSAGEPTPDDFEELRPYVGQAIAAMTAGEEEAFLVVNSDKALTAGQAKLDFQAHPVWKILIGGTQLSRGFTVEGLTISYYRRKTGQADTLMQAGRWFGFRAGYADLVRLYIRRDDDVDLYAAFEALLQDEEDFRSELKQYEGWGPDGKPLLEPRAIPPLVTQRLPWLRPTARNKMWHAHIAERVRLGGVEDLAGVPPLRTDDSAHNFTSIATPLLQLLEPTSRQPLAYSRFDGKGNESKGLFDAHVERIDSTRLLELLRSMRWSDQHDLSFSHTLRALHRVTAEGRLDEWALVWPQTVKGTRAHTKIPGSNSRLEVITRSWRDERQQFTGSDRKHANSLHGVALGEQGGLGASTRRGAVLVTLATDFAPKADDMFLDGGAGGVALLMSLYLPATPGLVRAGPIKWTVG